MDYNREIYAEIGEIIKSIQYIEWNLCLKLNIDTFSNMTLGQLKSFVIEEEILNEDDANELYIILDRRNDLVHKYFKRLDYEKHEDNEAFLENQYGYFSNFLMQVEEFNKKLL